MFLSLGLILKTIFSTVRLLEPEGNFHLFPHFDFFIVWMNDTMDPNQRILEPVFAINQSKGTLPVSGLKLPFQEIILLI